MKELVLLGVLCLTAGTAAATPVAAPAVVHVRNFAFDPPTLTIAPGVAVRFVNDDQVEHSVTAADKSFDSGDLDAGKSWTHVFPATGTYAYYCDTHPFMKGTIVVSEPKPE